MSTIRTKTATTARPSLAGAAIAAPAVETDLARRETSLVGGVLMTIVFLGLLGATVALAFSTVIA